MMVLLPQIMWQAWLDAWGLGRPNNNTKKDPK